MYASACLHAAASVCKVAFMSREKLLDAALRVYETDGFRGATTRRIAEAAGVNEITIFRLFGSKAALIDEALRRESREIPEPTVTLPQEPVEPERELTAWCAARMQQLRSRRVLILKTLSEAGNPAVSPCGQADRECAHKSLVSYTERLVAHGFASRSDPGKSWHEQVDAAVVMLMSALFADVIGRDASPEMFPQPAHHAPAVYSRLFLRALGAREASDRPENAAVAAS